MDQSPIVNKTAPQTCSSSLWLWSKALAILAGDDERLDHLGLDEVAVELVQLVQPEVVAVEVESGLRRVVRIATQVAEVLHQHKRPVEFLLGEG